MILLRAKNRKMADDSNSHAESSDLNAEIMCEKVENGALDDIVNEYEVLFKDRYTENDPTYVESVESITSVPPLIHPWYNKSRRNFDYSRDRSGHRDHHHHHRHEHSSSRHGSGSREHRSDRRYHPYHNDRHRDDRDRHERHHQY